MTLFSSCGENTSKAVESAESYFSALTEYSATAQVSMNHGEYVTEYVISHEYSDNTHSLTVIEPLSLSGLNMTFDGETTELRFKDMIFLPPSLDGTKATPMKLLPDVLSSVIKGGYEAAYVHKIEGQNCLTFGMWSHVDGEEFMYRVTVSEEDLELLTAEVFCNGRSVLTAEFTDVQIITN